MMLQNILRHHVDPPQQVLDGLRRELRVLLQRSVGVGHVGRVVLVVMDLHRFRIDVRLERVERVRKRWNLERHLGPPSN